MANPENPGNGPDNLAVNDEGNFVEGWESKYPENDRTTLKRFTGKNLDDFVTSYMSQRRMMNKDPEAYVEIPSDSATDEVRNTFYQRLGVPAAVEEYKFEKSKDLSNDIDIDENKIKEFAGIAHKHHLTNEQLNGVANDWLALVGKDIQNFDLIEQDRKQKEFDAADKELRKELGSGYDERVARTNMLLRKYKGQEMVAEAGLENNTAFIRFLDAIAEDMSEDRIKGIVGVSAPTPTDITTKINEMKAHPAFMDSSHPQHQDIVDQLSELYKKKTA